MFTEKEYRVAQERCKDSLAWAENERLARSIRPSTKGRGLATIQTRYQRWLARLGARLIRWGSRLEARYADALSAAKAVQHESTGIAVKTL